MDDVEIEVKESESARPGFGVRFKFVNLLPGQTCSIRLLSGAVFAGGISSAPEGLRLYRNRLTFTTPATSGDPGEYMSREFSAGMEITERNIAGSAELPGPAAFQMTVANAADIFTAGDFSHDIRIDVPPTCCLCGCGPANPTCPDVDGAKTKCYGYMGQFFCCLDPPYEGEQGPDGPAS
ncbi:MAG: hypothetical protein DMF67_13905 [Acidobacteria bacterium]|nr:MAG: hypothetical protein DMF67_13905 [Acidobacteriota bacterium]